MKSLIVLIIYFILILRLNSAYSLINSEEEKLVNGQKVTVGEETRAKIALIKYYNLQNYLGAYDELDAKKQASNRGVDKSA
jgi:hypothetical protein